MPSKSVVRTMQCPPGSLRAEQPAKGDQYRVTAVLSTSAPVMRMDENNEPYAERLRHNENDVDLSRMPLPVFEGHAPIVDPSNPGQVNAGIVTRTWFEADQLVGDIQLGERGKHLWTDIKNGIVRYMSVSYEVLGGSWAENADREFWANWRPIEVSFVGIPADHSAQVISSRSSAAAGVDVNLNEDKLMSKNIETTPVKNEVVSTGNEIQGNEQTGVEIRAMSETPNVPSIALADLQKRNNDILAMFSMPVSRQYTDLKDRCLTDMTITVDQARTLLLNKMGEGSEPVARPSAIQIVADEKTKFRTGIVQALRTRLGHEQHDPQNNFSSYSLMRTAEHILTMNGISIAGMMPYEIASRALSTSDYPYILEDIINKEMQTGMEMRDYTWRRLAKIGTLNDFRPHSRVAKGGQTLLQVIPEYGNYRAGNYGEKRELISARKMGHLIIFSLETMVNDDLQVFSDQATDGTAAAYETVESDYYDALNSNPVMSDGVAYYHATHNNLDTTAEAIGPAGVDRLRVFLATQLNVTADAGYVRTEPEILLVHEAIKGTALSIVNSEWLPGATNDQRNYVQGIATVESSPYVASQTEYHLIGRTRGFEIAFLNGQQVPMVMRSDHPDNDDLRWKVRLIYGVAAIQYRVQAKAVGA